MANNTRLNKGYSGDTIRTVEKNGVKTPSVVLDIGGNVEEKLLTSHIVSPFGTFATHKRTSLINLKSIHGISAFRDLVIQENGGLVYHPGPNLSREYELSCSANALGRAILETAEYGKFQPGFASEASIGVRVDFTNPLYPDQELKWGYCDATGGFGFGVDSIGKFVYYGREDTQWVKTYQPNWSVDKMDGTGDSGITLDLTKPHVYICQFFWYGFLSIEFIIMAIDPATGDLRKYTVHRHVPSDTSMLIDPNYPISAKVLNHNATYPTPKLLVSFREYSVLGEFIPNERFTSAIRLNVPINNTTWTPLSSWRKKANYESIAVSPLGFDMLANTDVRIIAFVNMTLNNPNWTDITNTLPSETSLQMDIAATVDGSLATGAGYKIYGNIHSGAAKINETALSRESFEFNMARGYTITFLARTVSSTTGSISFVPRFVEYW